MRKFNLLATFCAQIAICATLVLSSFTGFTQAASQVSVTGAGTTATVQNNVATVVDPNLIVSANGNISGFTVTITGSYTNGDILGYTGALPSGITTSGFNTSTRSLQFAGTASPTVWQDLLRRVTIRTTSAVCFPEQRKVSFNFGQVFYNILNDHFYQLVSASTSWTNARTVAQNSSYYGYQGYLTTITSAAENSFIQAFTDANSWLGCSDNFAEINSAVGFTMFANQAAAEGKWYWVTGPERGTQMRTGNANNNNLGSNLPGVYQSWSGGEPNDWPGAGIGEEDYGHMINNTGLWNDFANSQSISYLVEYGGMPNDLSVSNVVYTRTLNVNGAPTTGINGGNTSICSGGNATLTLAPFSGTVVRWEWSTDDFLTAGNPISSTSTTLNITGLTESRYYRAIINTTAPSCSNLATSSTLITVAVANGGIINAQSNAICAGGSAVLTLFGNQGSVIDWQRSTASNFSTFTTINSTSTSITNTISSAGTYYFRARVQNGSCGSPVFSATYIITVNSGTPPIGGTVSSATHCGGSSSGTLTLSGHTGTIQSWQFSDDFGVVWTTVSNTSTSISYSGITATRYYRAVLQNGSCGTAFSNVGIVTVYSFAASNSGPVCSGTELQLGVTTSGGNGPFTFAWTGPNNFSSSIQNPTIPNVGSNAAGTYSVVVSAPGCNTTVTTAVTVNASPSITAVTNNSRCGNGTVVLGATASAGTISWFANATGGSALSTGTSYTTPSLSATTSYWVSSTSGSCTTPARSEVIATINSTPTVASSAGAARCGAGTVTLSASASAGDIHWFAASSGGTALGVGNSFTTPSITTTTTYWAEARNGSCISAARTAVVATINAAPSLIPSVISVACNGGSNGAASVSASGGVAPYTYAWSPSGGSAANATGLTAGTYTVTVTGSNGCSAQTSVTVTQPTALVVNASSQTNVTCHMGNNGAASVSATGGAGGYTYNWTPGNPTGDGTASVTGLTAGTWTCTVTDANGCTASRNFTITQPSALSASIVSQTNVACNGGSTGSATVLASGGVGMYTYNWTPGNPIGDGTTTISSLPAGSYSVTVTDANACTATANLTIIQPSALVVNPATQLNIACNGGNNGAASVSVSGGAGAYTYNWTPGNPIGDGTSSVTGLTAGSWTCTVTDSNGCTASHTFNVTQPNALNLNVSSVSNVSCFGANDGSISLSANGGVPSYTYSWMPAVSGTSSAGGLSAGVYTVVLTDGNACQASQQITITEPAQSVSSITASACDSYSLNGETYTESGVYTQLLQNAAGCDSTLTLNLTILESTFASMDATACDSYSLNGETYTESGVYTQMLVNEAGCDSILTLNLTILESTFASLDATACDSYVLNGETYTESGVYTQMLVNEAGCDSTLTLNLTILESTFASLDATACDSYSLNGETYTESGVYTQMLVNEAGCDSTLTLNLTILESTFASMDATACDSYSLNGETYTESGVYTQVLQNAAGCDSTLTLNLTILESTFASLDATACDSYVLNGETYTESGVYTQMLVNEAGCDSTLTLNLTILESTFASMDATACDSYSLNGETYTESGVYTQVLQNAAGCDSTLTLNLTILESTFASLDATACDSYSLNGETYTESGVYTQVLVNEAGCDSILTLNVTILESTFETLNVSACDFYMFNDEMYNQSGVYTFIMQNAAGCDSTITLNLTVSQSTVENLDIVACDSYVLNGETFTESGVYVQNLQNENGCDHTVNLNLTILEGSQEELVVEQCNSYTYNGQTYTESGVYVHVFENAVGCDSIVTLNLTILESTTAHRVAQGCDSFILNGEEFTESGIYTQVIPNAVGCDSIIVLDLTIVHSSSVLHDIVAFQHYAVGEDMYTNSGSYSYSFVNAVGCDSIVTYNIIITQIAGDTNGDGEIGDGEIAGDTNGDGEIGDGEIEGDLDGDGQLSCEEIAILGQLTESMEVVSCGPYVFEGVEFIESGVYVQDFINEQGCIAEMVLTLEVVNFNLDIANADGVLHALEQQGVNYQWIDCDSNNPIEGANEVAMTPAASGNYAVQLSLGECSATTDCVEFIVVGQEEIDATVINIYPNPSQGIFRVQMTGTMDAQYEVFDAQGARVKLGRWTNGEHELNLEGNASGVYYLKLGERVFRLIVQ